VLFALGAERAVDASYLERAMGVLESDSGIAFVTCGLYNESTGFVWIGTQSLSGTVISSMRWSYTGEEAWDEAGGYVTDMPAMGWEGSICGLGSLELLVGACNS
jgi:hypothetical protein